MASRILREPGFPAAPFSWPQLGRPEPAKAVWDRPETAAETGPAPDGHALERALREREAQWRAELEATRRQAYAQGLEEGRREAEAQLEAVLGRLSRSIEEIAGLKARLRVEAEREVVELAVAVARRVLRRELHVDPEALLGLVKAAMEKASQREITEVRVHPSHAAMVRACLARIGAPEAIEVHADASLEPGAVMMETSRGTIDASLETQLEEINRGLTDVLHRRIGS
ncbi:MAG: FliH/SctL family protein [Bryobacteraceae bacterium]